MPNPERYATPPQAPAARSWLLRLGPRALPQHGGFELLDLRTGERRVFADAAALVRFLDEQYPKGLR